MKIAISTDGERVSGHFGRCPEFTILTLEGGELTQQELLPNPGHQPDFLPRFLQEKGVEMIIAGGMGPRAQQLFQQLGIQPVLGVDATLEEIRAELLAGTLRGGDSLCRPGAGKGYGLDKTACDHQDS